MCIGIMLGCVGAVLVSMYLVDVTKNDGDSLNLTNLKLSFTSIVYYEDRETGEYKEYQRLDGEENRVWVALDDIPDHVKNAFIAVEDKDFYKHHGVNFVRTFAAMINEYTPIKLFSSKQGASTITQQLVKNLTDDRDGSGIAGALRKVREIFRALVLEKQYSKDEILEAYLNTLRLSYRWGGVQAGANYFFGKNVSDLTLAEAASLAGITKNPYEYNPYEFPEKNIQRRNDILYFMFEQELITEEEYNAALEEELVLNNSIQQNSAVYSYFTDMVIDQVIDDLMVEYDMTKSEATSYLYNGGLRIYSTVDPNVQSAMEKVMKNDPYYKDGRTLFSTKENKYTKGGEEYTQTPEAAMVSVDYEGGIVGVVGGLGEKTENRVLNRAVDSIRHTGSSMKPIGAYAPALEYHYINYSTAIYDDYCWMEPDDKHPGQEREWPRNYNGKYSKVPVPVVHAIKKSLNTVAVRTLERLTPEASYDFLTNSLHISSLTSTDIGYSQLALGGMTYGISPLEMAAAYTIFGNSGKYITPYCYTTVEDSNGEVILETRTTTVQAISEETAYIMNRALRQVLVDGTGAGLGTKRMDSVGKTGTSSDDKDHWFVGVTPYYSTAVWYGYDEPAELVIRDYGAHAPTLAWRNVMDDCQKNLEHKSFKVPKGVVQMEFCRANGCIANANCPDREIGYYTEDNLPPVCTEH